MDPVIVASARNRGSPTPTCFTLTKTRSGSSSDLVMLIGGDESGRMLEIGVAAAEGIEFIVHAVPVRDKFLR